MRERQGTRLVKDVTDEPDYDAIVEALKKVIDWGE